MMYIRWTLQMLLNLSGFLTAPIVFPFAYLLKDIKIVREKLLWIYFDDEDEFGFDVEWWMGDKKRNFLTAYKWCALRNPAWNLHTLFLFDKNINIHNPVIKGVLYRDGKPLDFGLYTIANLKYIDENGTYMDNKGEILSSKYSTLGKQFVVFRDYATWKKYWRFSYAGNVYKSFWVELQLGYSTRPTFRFKIKNIKRYE